MLPKVFSAEKLYLHAADLHESGRVEGHRVYPERARPPQGPAGGLLARRPRPRGGSRLPQRYAQRGRREGEGLLDAGAPMVWVANPAWRSVTVYRSSTDIKTLTEKDELDGQDVVPGFRCRVSAIFENL